MEWLVVAVTLPTLFLLLVWACFKKGSDYDDDVQGDAQYIETHPYVRNAKPSYTNVA